MRALGLVLLGLGFLGASFVSVRTEANDVDWKLFVPMLALSVVGVALARVATHKATQQVGAVTQNVDACRRSLERIVDKIGRLDEEKRDLHPFDVHARIDELFPADLGEFVEAREAIAHAHGLGAYATVMNEFSAGERYLNRVWSASVDCYIDDVHEYLGRAREQFVRARDQLAALG